MAGTCCACLTLKMSYTLDLWILPLFQKKINAMMKLVILMESSILIFADKESVGSDLSIELEETLNEETAWVDEEQWCNGSSRNI